GSSDGRIALRPRAPERTRLEDAWRAAWAISWLMDARDGTLSLVDASVPATILLVFEQGESPFLGWEMIAGLSGRRPDLRTIFSAERHVAVVEINTPHGLARAHLRAVRTPRAAL